MEITMRMKNREGFALPLVILIIAILTAALAAGFTATSAEIETNSAQRSTNRAFNIAQSGLEQFLVRRNEVGFCQACMADPTDSTNNGIDSARVTVSKGFVDVIARRVRPYIDNNTPAMYFIKARGVDTSKSGALGGAARATKGERTVGVYATWNTNTMKVLGSWTSLTGLNKKGTAGVISGVDQCGKADTVAGVVTPKGDLFVSGQWTAIGDPPADTFKTTSQLEAGVGIDWNAVRNGNALTADITIPPGNFPDVGWFMADTINRWPIIHVLGDFNLPNKGQGTLIVDGDLAINGSDMWDGVILVGGKLTSNGINTVAGATISGLNKLLGATPDTSEINSDNSDANGNKNFLYNSCKVSRATQALRTYKIMPNTWMDNVVSW
jgi:type II secretory pathway pseudopilin PulG